MGRSAAGGVTRIGFEHTLVEPAALPALDVLNAGLEILEFRRLKQSLKPAGIAPADLTIHDHAEAFLERQARAGVIVRLPQTALLFVDFKLVFHRHPLGYAGESRARSSPADEATHEPTFASHAMRAAFAQTALK